MYLILFDIDGTLVLTGRAGWRAMNRACAVEVGHDSALEGVEFAGRTDWSILRDIMGKHDKPMDRALLDNAWGFAAQRPTVSTLELSWLRDAGYQVSDQPAGRTPHGTLGPKYAFFLPEEKKA